MSHSVSEMPRSLSQAYFQQILHSGANFAFTLISVIRSSTGDCGHYIAEVLSALDIAFTNKTER